MIIQAVTAASSGSGSDQLRNIAPGVVAAASFAACNVLCPFVYAAGTDVLTLTLLRGVAGLGFVLVALHIGQSGRPHSPRERLVALGLGVLFAGVIFGIFAALAALPVSIAVLAYFVYPLLTGLCGWLLGVDRIGWRGAVAALTAFGGLALMIGVHPHALLLTGLGFAIGAACCRTAILLIARTTLQEADPLLTTWYSLVSSTAILALVALVTWNWMPPQTTLGWTALIAVSVANAIGVLALFVSTRRIGPVRTALMMNLEPILSTIGALVLLGQELSALQLLGGATMLAALGAFQLRR